MARRRARAGACPLPRRRRALPAVLGGREAGCLRAAGRHAQGVRAERLGHGGGPLRARAPPADGVARRLLRPGHLGARRRGRRHGSPTRTATAQRVRRLPAGGGGHRGHRGSRPAADGGGHRRDRGRLRGARGAPDGRAHRGHRAHAARAGGCPRASGSTSRHPCCRADAARVGDRGGACRRGPPRALRAGGARLPRLPGRGRIRVHDGCRAARSRRPVGGHHPAAGGARAGRAALRADPAARAVRRSGPARRRLRAALAGGPRRRPVALRDRPRRRSRHRSIRPAALPRAAAPGPDRRHRARARNGGGVCAATRPGARRLRDDRDRRGSRRRACGARRAEDGPVRRLLRHVLRPALRARTPRPRRPADPRLGGPAGERRARPAGHVARPARAPDGAVRREPLPRDHARPGRRPRIDPRSAACGAVDGADLRRPRTVAGRAHRRPARPLRRAPRRRARRSAARGPPGGARGGEPGRRRAPGARRAAEPVARRAAPERRDARLGRARGDPLRRPRAAVGLRPAGTGRRRAVHTRGGGGERAARHVRSLAAVARGAGAGAGPAAGRPDPDPERPVRRPHAPHRRAARGGPQPTRGGRRRAGCRAQCHHRRQRLCAGGGRPLRPRPAGGRALPPQPRDRDGSRSGVSAAARRRGTGAGRSPGEAASPSRSPCARSRTRSCWPTCTAATAPSAAARSPT